MATPDPDKPPNPYANSLLIAAVTQTLAILSTSTLLDGGLMLEICLFCVAGFWPGIFFVMKTRPRNPTSTDLLLIRWGFIPLLVVTCPLAMWIWHLRGLM